MLKQFDDLLVKASPRLVALQAAFGKVHAGLSRALQTSGFQVAAERFALLQILIAAAVVDLFIALINGESGLRCDPSQRLCQKGQSCKGKHMRGHTRLSSHDIKTLLTWAWGNAACLSNRASSCSS